MRLGILRVQLESATRFGFGFGGGLNLRQGVVRSFAQERVGRRKSGMGASVIGKLGGSSFKGGEAVGKIASKPETTATEIGVVALRIDFGGRIGIGRR